MTIIREIEGKNVEIELTASEMAKAYVIVHENDLHEFVDGMLRRQHPDIWNDEKLRNDFHSCYLHEWYRYDGSDDDDVSNLVLEEGTFRE